MADASPKQILEETIPSRLASREGLAEEIGAAVVFRITGSQGGEWTLDCSSGKGEVRPGADPAARMTITASDADFVQVATGKLDPTMAAMSGKLKLDPMDMGLGLKLVKLLS
ncbi:MAG TPA: SCP2 sterol-binding domain-containing protein [Vulgatibacter sp.]|nr:SCP2 sterol-binding domain-containing protein [Vulgatibacter sp.]